MPFTFKSNTLSHPQFDLGELLRSSGSPHDVPALLMRQCNLLSNIFPTCAANSSHPCRFETFETMYWHCNSAAASWHASSERLVRTTLAPAWAKPWAIMYPIPREPPVTRTFFPATENRVEGLVMVDMILLCSVLQIWVVLSVTITRHSQCGDNVSLLFWIVFAKIFFMTFCLALLRFKLMRLHYFSLPRYTFKNRI